MTNAKSATDARFQGSIPAIYEQYMGPLFFVPYAEDLAARLEGLSGGAVLEVAAGTGIVTQKLAETLSPDVRIVATDLNEAMLQVAKARPLSRPVTWQQANAQQLPFADDEFDAVVCQFGFMFLPDRGAGYREALRVLKPGGKLLFNVWDRLEANEVSLIIARQVEAFFPNDPPRFVERTPFGYWDTQAIRADVAQAGFQRVELESVEKVTYAALAEHAAIGLCQGSPLRGEIEARAPERLDEITKAASEALATRFGRESMENRMRAHVVTAHRA